MHINKCLIDPVFEIDLMLVHVRNAAGQPAKQVDEWEVLKEKL